MISVIGGSGFIGTRLCKRLQQENAEFEIVDIVESRTFPKKHKFADVRNADALTKQITGDVIINLAAEHRDDVTPKSLYDEVNVDGARRLCEVAEAKNIKTIIFTSSVAVYGFAPIGTDETGKINFFNDYGRTKYEAEEIFRQWLNQDKKNRRLIIIRPTVVFGEENRGNVYNLLRQIASGKFVMIGNGLNRKSMAYVENIAAFLQYSMKFENGLHVYNYIDKPDFNMNDLVKNVYRALGKNETISFRIPYVAGFFIGKIFDLFSYLTSKKFAISSIRVKKFCSDSMYNTSLDKTGFKVPVPLKEALNSTIISEFGTESV